MAEQIVESRSKFNSPIPLLRRLSVLIFGETKPDNYTQLTFYINLFFWATFLIWSIASYMTLSFRGLILETKKIDVEQVINERGNVLGFLPHELMDSLLTVHAIGIICWLVVFIGIVLIWRKNTYFIYFVLGGLIFYTGMLIFYLSFSYFSQDTTLFDKIGLLAMFLSSVIYYFLLRKEHAGGSINFFEEED